MGDNDARIILKGESHFSRNDLEKEFELIKQGFDVLVLEGAEGDSEYTLFGLWFHFARGIMFWLMDPMYQSKDSLIHLAEAQNTEIVRTRESETDVLENASVFARLIAFMVFVVITLCGLVAGIQSDFWFGYLVTIAGIIVPPIYLRKQNMVVSTGENNRDKLMADTIAEAAQEDKSVLAVVGAKHIDGIQAHLPDDLDVAYYPPENTIKNRPDLQSQLINLGESFLLSLGLYFVVIHSTTYLIKIFS